MKAARNNRRGYTLVEMLTVVAIVGLLAAMVLPSFNPSIGDGITSAARILSADLAYARSLAVTNNSQYKLTFDTVQNRYVLTHSGANTLLHALPPSPFRRPDDPPNQQTTDLDDLPHTGPTPQLFAALSSSLPPQTVTDVEFGPLGGTTRSATMVVWLSGGSGDNLRFVSVSIDPITGLTSIGDPQATRPPTALSSGAVSASPDTLPTGT